MPEPDQYTTERWRTTLPAQVMRGSQIGWNLVNSALLLTTLLPPTKAMRDQSKLMLLMVELCAGMLWPLASMSAPTTRLPAAMALLTSVRKTLASATAPLTLSWPAPCCTRL